MTSLSDPYILTESGFHDYTKYVHDLGIVFGNLHTFTRSIGFAEECLGMHYGKIHEADLGDGLGRKEEHFLARQSYFPVWGTCWESIRGGHHFRAWKQNGTMADSGAWFIG